MVYFVCNINSIEYLELGYGNYTLGRLLFEKSNRSGVFILGSSKKGVKE